MKSKRFIITLFCSVCFVFFALMPNILRAGGDYTFSSIVRFDSVATNVANDSVILAKKHHSPTKATVLSAVLPGAGQVYNHQAWKVPIIYAAAATVTYFAITNGKNRSKFKDEYYNRINGNTDLLLPDYVSYTNEGIYNLYNTYKSNFQLSIIIGIAFYAVQVLDAYVYGHLFNFDLTEDLSLNLTPYYYPTNIFSLSNANSSSFGLSLNLRF